MKKILYILVLSFILFSCSSETENKEVAKTIDRSTPENVLNWYALFMKDCDLNNWLEYFEPEIALLLKQGYSGMINWTLDAVKWFAWELWKETQVENIQKQQDKINTQLEKTWLDKIDYNKFCKESNWEITNFKILDTWEINWNKAKFNLSYTAKWENKEEFWYLKKVWNDWFLLDGEEKNNTSTNNENIESKSINTVVENGENISNNSDLSTNEYNWVSFSKDQYDQIRYWLESKVNVAIYAKSEFSVDQMKEIRYWLESKVDAKIYANPEFSVDQMKEIKYWLEAWLDASSYAKVEYSPDQMKEKRYSLEK